jgi:uncharacterized protein (TIGR02271 family)
MARSLAARLANTVSRSCTRDVTALVVEEPALCRLPEPERRLQNMANRPPVHVESTENGWTVVREGSERATSVYSTQSEAAAEGRELARRDGTEFFLHAQDGRVREHRNYGEGSSAARSEDKGLVDRTTETAGTLVGGLAGAASTAMSSRADAITPAGNAGGQEAEPSGRTTGADSREGTNEEEVRGLTDSRQNDASRTPGERYAGYEVYSQDGERLGKPDDLFVDENDNPEYLGVRTDRSGGRAILVPAEVVTVEDAARRMVVSHPNGLVQAGPGLERGEELTPELEVRVRTHYGLQGLPSAEGSGGYGAYYRDDAGRGEERGLLGKPGTAAPTISSGAEGDAGGVQDREGTAEPSILEANEEEVRVHRSEEELKVEAREREAGAVRVRKRVRTDREQIVVPKKRVEVTVERVPVVEGETARSEIGEDEIVVPIVEEEVVVEKRPVVKEELRIRKEVVEETETVEEDVRREEIEVDDESTTREDN